MCSRTLGAADTLFRIIRIRSRSFTLHDSLLLPLRREHPRILPQPSCRLSLSPSRSILFFCLRTSRGFFEVARNLAPTDTPFRISCITAALVFTRRSCNLLIAIEQLSDRKLIYSCSLDPFPFSTILPRTFFLHVFYLSPFRCRALTHVPFQAPDCTTNRIKSGIREKVIL